MSVHAMKSRIILIGCGKMGSAMLHGWLSDSGLDAEFLIVEPAQDHLSWTASHDNVHLHGSVAGAAADGRAATMVVLAVKPQMMDASIGSIGPLRDDKTAFLTIAAGISTSWLKCRLGSHPSVLRAMPNTPAAIGKGVTGDTGVGRCQSTNTQNHALDLPTQNMKLLVTGGCGFI